MKNYASLKPSEMPQEFQDRIIRFSKLFEDNGKSFLDDNLGKYEMNCCRQAISFVDYFNTFESPADTFISLVNEKNTSDVIEYLSDKIPYFDDNHSYNSINASFYLAYIYIIKPNFLQYVHGSLAPLVGDEGYYDNNRKDIKM